MKHIYLLFFLASFISFGQEGIPVCKTSDKNQELIERSAEARQAFDKMKSQIANAQKQNPINGIYKVPMVVHIMHTGEAIGTGSNLTDQDVFYGVQYLNNYWRKILGSNGDADGVDMEIEFELASFDPNGASTNGIVRYDLSGVQSFVDNGVGDGGLEDHNSDVAVNSLKEYSHWNGEHYYNVWIVDKIDGENCFDAGDDGSYTAGYAYYANQHGMPWDGSLLLACVFQDETSTTWAHEMGHALNLPHTFDGDKSTVDGETVYDCGDDGITDTPSHIRASAIPDLYWDCNNTDENDCDPNFNEQISPTKTGNGTHQDHIKNIMNYAGCTNEFTPGQRAVSKDALVNIRTSYLNSPAFGSCDAVELTISAITSNSFTVDWPLDANTTYVLQIYLGEEDPNNLLYNESHDSSNTPINITNATPDTEYYVKVIATCSNGSTPSAGEYVYTLCEPITTAWSDDFSDETYGCWEVINDGDTNTWTLETTYDNGTVISGMYHIIYSETEAHNDWLLSPPISVTDGVTDGISFIALNELLSYPESVDIYVLDQEYQVLGILAENVTPPDDAWQNYTYDLSNYEGQTIRVGFHSTTLNQYILYLDNFEVFGNILDNNSFDISEIKISPNPVIDQLTVQANTTIAHYKLYSLTGQILKENVVSSKTFNVDMSSLNTGVYFMEFVSSSNQKETIQIIKK